MSAPASDDRWTMIAIAALASMLQDVLHEGCGHAGVAWLSGAHTVTISTVAMQSDIDTRWISASGTLVNLAAGLVIWLLLRKARGFSPAWRYFLVLSLAASLFTGTGYFFFSGVASFGDWEAVIQGLSPHWAWQIGLVAVGVPAYFGAMLVVGAELKAFRLDPPGPRLRSLCFTPYITDGILAGVAGLLNPAGLFYVIASALPATLGAQAGLLSLPMWVSHWKPADEPPVGPLRRSWGWIIAGAAGSLIFIAVLGPGVHFSR